MNGSVSRKTRVRFALYGLLLCTALCCIALFAGCANNPAAIINNNAIPEDDVEEYIEDQKEAWGFDETNWADFLTAQGKDDESYRLYIIEDRFEESALADQLATVKKIDIEDEELDAALAKAKEDYEDEEAFQQHLLEQAMTEDNFRSKLKTEIQIRRIDEIAQQQAAEEGTPYLLTNSEREDFLLEYAELYCDATEIEDIPTDVVEKLEALLAQQNKLQEEGKYFEASAVTAEVVVYNADATVAWSQNSTIVAEK